MNSKANYIRIGIFVLIAIFLLVAGLLAFGAKSYFATKLTYETAIQGDVTGLSVGSGVLYRGIPIGKVSNIVIAPNIYPDSTSDVIVVVFEVDQKIFKKDQTTKEREQLVAHEVGRGLRAMVKLQSITGTSVLFLQYLNPKNYPPLAIDYKPENPYIPSAPSQVTRMLESIDASLQNLQKLDFGSIGSEASNALAQTSILVEQLNRMDLKETVTKANNLLDTLNTTVGNVNTTVAGMKLDQLGGNADDLLVQLKESNRKLQTVMDKLGSAPLSETVDNLNTDLQTLNAVLLELKRYPSGFIFGEPPRRAKSVEPPAK
ncbi:MAG TPA: MlaD family protein [Pseudomonadales bacterium]|nr:MlaD family protein [Pseudomonadales bacterium]